MPDSRTTDRWKMVREGGGSNTVLIFGLVSIALVAIVGTAIDFSRLASARSELQERLDRALAAAATEDSGERVEIAEDVFDQMPTGSVARATLRRFEDDEQVLRGTVSAAVPTTLSSVIGIRAIRVTASGTAMPPAPRCADPVIRVKDKAGCAIVVRTSTRTVPQH